VFTCGWRATPTSAPVRVLRQTHRECWERPSQHETWRAQESQARQGTVRVAGIAHSGRLLRGNSSNPVETGGS
jgi:hypothetical protein